MNITQLENNLKKLVVSYSKENFIYDLLTAYGLPKASITRLRKGNLNLSKQAGELSWKKKVLYRETDNKDLYALITELSKEVKHDQRFVIVTNHTNLLAIDTKTEDRLDIEVKELPKHGDFFAPWAGMEKAQHQNENPADVKAAERMAKLFDEIKKDNPDGSPEFVHGLNVFLSRLLFCFFAEDTDIFKENHFTNSIDSHTQVDGSDLNEYLDKLFDTLNTPKKERHNIPHYLEEFPFVNGGLFRKRKPSPSFRRKSRRLIIAAGELTWKDINPDIFGSMFQAVIGEDQRGNLGQHYTSVPNIMKVINPLFLDELKEEAEKAKGNTKKVNELLNRIHKIKIFDPACGSGNFLIIAYKELRRLEMQIFKENGLMALSGISLSQFYGIEIDDFAHEIAQLSLWLAEHQMNVEFFQEFGQTNPTLPLKEAGKIVCGNACRIDWEEVCPKEKEDEIYILGNPPYLGSSLQSIEQKNDVKIVLSSMKGFKNMDYIACWFYKGSQYIANYNSKFAFVSTNSICQGEQVYILWKVLIKENEIDFAYPSFKWSNSAKGKAGVTVVIIGMRNFCKRIKYIYSLGTRKNVFNINPYLVEGDNLIVSKRSTPLSSFIPTSYGSKAVDGGHLILSSEEKVSLLKTSIDIDKYLKRFVGSNEFIKGTERWCLWIDDNEKENALSISEINKRVTLVRALRLKSKKLATRKSAKTSYAFGERRYSNTTSVLIPSVSSERRKYLPVGFLNSNFVISNSAHCILNATPFEFGILASKMHILWIKAVCGSLESRIRYSSQLGYNTFPFSQISSQRKQEITQCVFRILAEREKHPEKTLAQLYDPDKMPDGLREAHKANDEVIERCYRSKPFENDEERLEYLFKLYEKMIEEEKENGTLFKKEKKTRKTKKA